MDLDAIVAASQRAKKEVGKERKKERSMFFRVIRFGEMFLVFLDQILFLTTMTTYLPQKILMALLQKIGKNSEVCFFRVFRFVRCFWFFGSDFISDDDDEFFARTDVDAVVAASQKVQR